MAPAELKIFLLFLTGNAIVEVMGHGRMMKPPSRVSLWRDSRYEDIGIKDYDDNAYNCGGYWYQWNDQKGKCGICGDPVNGVTKAGYPGKYAQNIIVDTYTSGEVITITIKLTANHKGWFEFRLCPHNDLKSDPTQDCLDRNILQLADGSGTRHIVKTGWGNRDIRVRLPAGVTCSRCVLQWKYHTGTRWDKNCPACGPQEQFYACSDIAISGNGGGNNVRTTTLFPSPVTPPCRGSGALALSDEVAKQCAITCAKGCCPPELCNRYCRNVSP